MKTFLKPLKSASLFFFLSLMAGILAGNASPDNTAYVLPVMTALSVLLFLAVYFHKKYTFFLMLGLLFCFGYFSFQFKLFPRLPPHHIAHYLDSEPSVITGKIVSFAAHYDTKSRVTLLCQTLERENHKKVNITGRICLNIYGFSKNVPEFGDCIAFKGSVRSVRNFMNPGAFDYKRFLKLKGIFGTAYTDIAKIKIVTDPDGRPGLLSRVIRKIGKIRTAYYYFILNQTDGSDAGKIMASLVTGKKEILSSRLRDLFSKAGVSHLLAISGLHLSIVGLLFFHLFYRTLSFIPAALVSGNARKAAGVLTIVPLIGYAVFTGFSPSTRRALIMIIVLLFSFISEREKDIYSSLAVAGILILVMDAAALFSISFQLSFMAVFFIVCGVSLLKKTGLIPKSQVPARVGLMIGVTFFGGLGTFPLTAHYFNIVSTIALISNLIFIPVLGFMVLPLGMMSLACLFYFPSAAVFIVHVCHGMISFLIPIADFLASLPFSWTRVVALQWKEILVIYFVLAAIFLSVRGQKKQAFGLFFVSFLLTGLTILNAGLKSGSPPQLAITVIDVGQGSSALIQTAQGKNILVDGGGFSDTASFDPGRFIVAPFLWQKKIKALDYVILSHPESDHLNGLIFILENFKVDTLIKNADERDSRNYRIFSETCTRKNIRIRQPSPKGEELFLGKTRVLFFKAPPHGEGCNFNNNSLVFKLVYKDFSMLFPGDILTNREESLSADEKTDLSSSILLSPHHGSSTSSTKFFLDKVQPKSVIVSCGWRNRYNFPHLSVLKRYHEMGIRIFRTDENGAIVISSDGAHHHIKTSKGG